MAERGGGRSRGRTALLLGALALGCTSASSGAPRLDDEVAVVTRGPFERTLLITGQLAAARSEELLVPQTESWAIALRWLVEDGAVVSQGDRLAELDNTAILEQVSDHELALIQAGIELSSARATSAVGIEEKRFAVETQRIALAKAKVDAEVSPELVSVRDYQKLQLAVKSAETALATAKDDLDAAVEAGRLAEEVKRIAYEKAERRLEGATEQLDALALVAPRDGVAQVGDHPWEGRKVQVGDTVWPGMAVVSLPDLASIVVEAQLSDVDDGLVRPGAAARCVIDAHADRPLEAVVQSVGPVAREPEHQSARRFFPVVLSLTEPDAAILRPGLSVKAEVVIDSRDEVLQAPRVALDPTSEPPRARLRSGEVVEVELGPCNALRCEVLAGLAEGDELGAWTEAAG